MADTGDTWGDQEAGTGCYLCAPRLTQHPGITLIARLAVSTLYLGKEQRFRGASILILEQHATRLDELEPSVYAAYMDDLRRSGRAIRGALQPDHMNFALLGNSCPHLHWAIVPRYRNDSRWGRPVWVDSVLQDMRNNRATLPEADFAQMIARIRGLLEQI